MNIRNNIKYQNQQGFTLIESLLTLFILTIGVLGAAGLQMQGLRAGSVAMQRTVAVMKSQDIVERMRANNNFIERRNVAGSAPSLMIYAAAGGADEGCNTGTVCDSAQMASNDVFHWRNDLQNALPGFDSAIIDVTAPVTMTAPTPVTVTIRWFDRGDEYTYTLSVDI